MGDNEDDEPQEQFSPESKVGLFVLAGMAVLMISILMLGDIHFRPQNTIFVLFRNVEGITDKSPVKVSGVEIGTVKTVELADDHAKLTLALRKDVRVYRSARVRIRSTGIIGTKFIALDPGHGTDSDLLRNEDTINGEDALSLDELMERVATSLDQFTNNGKTGRDLGATIANLRSITDSLNAALGQQRQSLVNIVKNFEGFSASAKSAAAHLDDVLSNSKEEIKIAIHDLKETLDKSNAILGQVQNGQGVLGTLVSDQKAGQDVKETVANLKHVSEEAKDVLARFTKVRAFWEIQARRDFKAGVYRGDVGLRLEPRPNKFYEIMGQNLSTEGSTSESPSDFERHNTITALIGQHWGVLSGAVGVIQSRAGVEALYRPFQETDVPVLNRLEFIGQGFDFGRDAIINGRHMTNPNYTAGALYRVNQWVKAGVQAEDIAETTDLHGVVNVSFEDKDIAYLLGFTSFAR
ncbi:MAG TPA: MlaD family protein [Elusimicrobiota bacterium]|nr:MlaD family protein [Elusimicrobiota bacterium]